eukprot:1028196-Pleurochrysis_carterae.AAC.2
MSKRPNLRQCRACGFRATKRAPKASSSTLGSSSALAARRIPRAGRPRHLLRALPSPATSRRHTTRGGDAPSCSM